MTKEKTVISDATHLYEDDGLLILFVIGSLPSEVESVIAAARVAGWDLYIRLPKHEGVYLIFLF